MALTTKQKFELKKFVRELSQFSGRHTELVSVYIPAGYDINKINNHLQQEQGTAANIKSASTRKNVIAALERIIQHLKIYKQTPPNGLAVFAGNVAEREGQEDIRVWSIEPPVPLKTRIYRCDKKFQLDLLADMLETKEVYGLVVMDRRDASLAFLKGKAIVPLVKTHSEVPGKTRAGGQCILPSTLIETNSTTLLSEIKIGDDIKSYNFKKDKIEESKVIDKWTVKKNQILKITTEENDIIYSSKDHLFFTKDKKEKPAEKLNNKDFLLKIKNNKLSSVKIKSIKITNKPTKMVDISVKNQNFIANGIITHNSAARFSRLREGATKNHYKKVAEYMKDQFLPVKELKGIIIGGPSTTTNDFMNKDYLTGDLKKKIIGIKDLSYTGEFGLQELLDKSQDLLAKEEVTEEKEIMQKFFNLLSKKPGMVAYGKAEVKEKLKLGAVETLLISEDVEEKEIDEFEKLAEEMNSALKIISTETREGVQLRDMGKFAAILRYEIQS